MNHLEFRWVSFPGEMDERKSKWWAAFPAIAIFHVPVKISPISFLHLFSMSLFLAGALVTVGGLSIGLTQILNAKEV